MKVVTGHTDVRPGTSPVTGLRAQLDKCPKVFGKGDIVRFLL